MLLRRFISMLARFVASGWCISSLTGFMRHDQFVP